MKLGALLAGIWLVGLGVASQAAEPPPTRVLEPDRRAPGERLPLVVYLHGLGGSGADAIEEPALANLARRHRMFVVAPDGDRDRAGRRFWNAGACCNFDRASVDDTARLAALIDRWRQRPEIDPARVYVLGFSNGGFMAHRLACRIPDRLTAVVSIAGAGPDAKEPCSPSSHMAVLEVHGDSDPIVRYQGGRVFDSAELAPHPSAPETIELWSRRLRCAGKPTAKTDGRSEAAFTVQGYRCASGSAELWTVRGGGHQLVSPEVVDRVASFLLKQVKPPQRRTPSPGGGRDILR